MENFEGKERVTRLLLENPQALQARVLDLLYKKCGCESLFENEDCRKVLASSVMLLLGEQVVEPGGRPEICLILNKRSKQVRQAGDLCCPGGTVEARLDPYLAKFLTLPGTPLSRWPHWSDFRRKQPLEARLLSLMLATGLRESWEEMRLNPFFTSFLGPLPAQCLIVFRRVIHPLVGWVNFQKHFIPSWEVEKIVAIPLRAFLNPAHYGCYRLYVPPQLAWRFKGAGQLEYPCFLHNDRGETELLWGVTYRIVTLFVELVFGFTPPLMETLPLVPGVLDESYVYGNGRGRKSH